jgi:hypothetical protein
MASTASEIRGTEINRPPSWRPALAVTTTVIAWASAFVVIRYAAHDIRPGALSLGRLLVASLALSAMMIGRKLVRLNAREWTLTAVVGVAWFAGYSIALKRRSTWRRAGCWRDRQPRSPSDRLALSELDNVGRC